MTSRSCCCTFSLDLYLFYNRCRLWIEYFSYIELLTHQVQRPADETLQCQAHTFASPRQGYRVAYK